MFLSFYGQLSYSTKITLSRDGHMVKSYRWQSDGGHRVEPLKLSQFYVEKKLGVLRGPESCQLYDKKRKKKTRINLNVNFACSKWHLGHMPSSDTTGLPLRLISIIYSVKVHFCHFLSFVRAQLDLLIQLHICGYSVHIMFSPVMPNVNIHSPWSCLTPYFNSFCTAPVTNTVNSSDNVPVSSPVSIAEAVDSFPMPNSTVQSKNGFILYALVFMCF